MTVQYTLYVKDGCELCEQFVIELSQSRPDLLEAINIVDIYGNAELISLYGDKIPVLMKDGHMLCQYYFNDSALI